MGLRGPRPAPEEKKREALGLLDGEAQVWANLLMQLRDGEDGWSGKVTWGPLEEIKGMGPFRPGQIFDAVVLPKTASNETLRAVQLKKEGWAYIPPIQGQRQIWDRLKAARAIREIFSVARDFRRWIARSPGGYMIVHGRKVELDRSKAYGKHWHVLHDHAKEILAAKKLWTYPGKSDDKRIKFFAKSLAGLSLGLAPATAQRRLTGWRWPIRDFKETRKKFFEQMKDQAERRKGVKQ